MSLGVPIFGHLWYVIILQKELIYYVSVLIFSQIGHFHQITK